MKFYLICFMFYFIYLFYYQMHSLLHKMECKKRGNDVMDHTIPTISIFIEPKHLKVLEATFGTRSLFLPNW